MEFSDFKDNPKELIGKLVLVDDNAIRKITRVTKTSFGINDSDKLFSLINGRERTSGRWHWSTCRLITEEKASEYRKKWAEHKQAMSLMDEIGGSLKTMPLETLRKIKQLISE